MTPTEFADVIALPTARDCVASPADRRLTYLACIAVYHLTDYVAHAEGISGKEVGDRVREFCNASMNVVHGLANGTKHPRPRRFGPQDVEPVPAFAFGDPEGGWGRGSWGGQALVIREGENTLFVHQCVQAVLLTLRDVYPAHLLASDFSFIQPFMLSWHSEAAESRLRRSAET